MNKRMTWDEIVHKYPDQWVGLTDVEWEDQSNVRSAIVKYTNTPENELLMMQVKGEGVYTKYTTPDNLGQLGFVGCLS